MIRFAEVSLLDALGHKALADGRLADARPRGIG